MDKRSMVFVSDLYLYLARSYKLINPAIPLCSTLWKTSTDFNEDIGKAVLALSYSYRTVFRTYIEQVFPYTMDSNYKTHLYVEMFAKKTCSNFSPFKFLVICSFVSELLLFRYFNLPNKNGFREYVELCVNCFGSAYDAVLSKTFPLMTGYQDLRELAKPLAAGYNTLMPIYANEHPTAPTPFLETFLVRYNDGLKKYQADGRIPSKGDTDTLAPKDTSCVQVPSTATPAQESSTKEPKPENPESAAVKQDSCSKPTDQRDASVKSASRPENPESTAVKLDSCSKPTDQRDDSVKSVPAVRIAMSAPIRAGQRRASKKK